MGEGEADSEAIYNWRCILKSTLQKSCHKYNCNIALFIYMYVPWPIHQFHARHPNFLFCFSVFQCTRHPPISVTDFGWKVNHEKRSISNFDLGKSCSPAPPPPPMGLYLVTEKRGVHSRYLRVFSLKKQTKGFTDFRAEGCPEWENGQSNQAIASSTSLHTR
jgi:hypothetical protein